MMENRHIDALVRIFQADQRWTAMGREPAEFRLVHEGAMKSHIDHPAWDDSWGSISVQTIDDLESQEYLRVAPHHDKRRSFDLSMKGREMGAELELERGVPPRVRPGSATPWDLEVAAAVAVFLSRIGNDSFSKEDFAAGIDVSKFEGVAAIRELRRLEVEKKVERAGRGWRAVAPPGGPYFHVRILPIDAKDLMSGPLYALDLSEEQVIQDFVAPFQAGLPIRHGNRELVRYRDPKVTSTPNSGKQVVETIESRLQGSRLVHAANEGEEALFKDVGEDVTANYFDPNGPVSNRHDSPLERAPGIAGDRQVFVVHGHSRADEVVRFLERSMGSTPVVLAEQAGRGRTIIEKFEDHAGAASFAVVLLTGDDVGRSKDAPDTESLLRARQNVILELGYFVGAIGRENVVGLLEDGVEEPSDWNGVEYVRFDKEDGWKLKLAKELEAAGFDVDRSRA